MQLERVHSVVATFALLVGVSGCAAATPPATPPRAPMQGRVDQAASGGPFAPFSTTRVNAAFLDLGTGRGAGEAESAPRVGKSQLSTGEGAEPSEHPSEEKSEETPRRDDGRHGGGFSGWK